MLGHQSSGSRGYRIELLRINNWMLWKRHMLTILRDLYLEEYIEKDSRPPVPKKISDPTDDEKVKIKMWKTRDAKVRTRIELALGDAKIIHDSTRNVGSANYSEGI